MPSIIYSIIKLICDAELLCHIQGQRGEGKYVVAVCEGSPVVAVYSHLAGAGGHSQDANGIESRADLRRTERVGSNRGSQDTRLGLELNVDTLGLVVQSVTIINKEITNRLLVGIQSHSEVEGLSVGFIGGQLRNREQARCCHREGKEE